MPVCKRAQRMQVVPHLHEMLVAWLTLLRRVVGVNPQPHAEQGTAFALCLWLQCQVPVEAELHVLHVYINTVSFLCAPLDDCDTPSSGMPCHSDHAPMMRLVSAGAQRHIEQQQQLPLGLGGPGPGRVVQQPRQQHVPAGPRDADRPDSSVVDRKAAEALPHPEADAARAAAAGPAAGTATVLSRQQGREQQQQVGRL